MDERQRQVEVGSGLQESRLNEDFINLLQKYGGRVIYIVLAIVLTYVGWNYWKDYREQQLDRGFRALDEAIQQGSPDVLLRVADDHAGKASIAPLARIEAGTILLDAARAGVEPGVDPAAAVETDRLSAERIDETYRRAEQIFQRVLADSSVPPMLAQDARWGLATAQISLGNADGARQTLEQFVQSAERLRYADQVAAAQRRLSDLDLLVSGIPLIAEAELPASAKPRPITPLNITPGVPGVNLTPNPDGPPLPINSPDFVLPPTTTDPGAGSDEPVSDDPASADPGSADPGSADPGSADPGSADPGR